MLKAFMNSPKEAEEKTASVVIGDDGGGVAPL